MAEEVGAASWVRKVCIEGRQIKIIVKGGKIWGKKEPSRGGVLY